MMIIADLFCTSYNMEFADYADDTSPFVFEEKL